MTVFARRFRLSLEDLVEDLASAIAAMSHNTGRVGDKLQALDASLEQLAEGRAGNQERGSPGVASITPWSARPASSRLRPRTGKGGCGRRMARG